MVAAMATMASTALPPSARIARPASTAAACGAQTTPRRWPALCRSAIFRLVLSSALGMRGGSLVYCSGGGLTSRRLIPAESHDLQHGQENRDHRDNQRRSGDNGLKRRGQNAV